MTGVVGMVLEFGMEIKDIFPLARAQAAAGIDVIVAVAALGVEHAIAMLFLIAAQERGEGSAVETVGRLAPGELDEGGQQIRQTDHGVIGRTRPQLARPDRNEGYTNA